MRLLVKYKDTVDEIINRAIKEDLGDCDVTTSVTIPVGLRRKSFIIAREGGVLCGINIAREVFKKIDSSLRLTVTKKDGSTFRKEAKIMSIEGDVRSILMGERTALNFLSWLSGIATFTREFVRRTKGTQVKVMDTRKTTPTLRILEKYAVRCGGGKNHRYGLWDGILIKDNHLKASGMVGKSRVDVESIGNLIKDLKKAKSSPVEIEVDNLHQFYEIIKCGPHIVMLDNFPLPALKKAVSFRNRYFPRVKLEASGGITLRNIGKIARTGVDFISVGALTHSAKSIDFSLEVVDEQ